MDYIDLDSRQKQNLGLLLGVSLFFWISITVLFPTLPTYVEYLGGTKPEIGLIMGSFAVGSLFSRTLLGYLADTKSRKLVLYIGVIIAALSPLNYLFVQTILPLSIVRAIHGISISAFTTAYSALVIDFSPIKHRGRVIGYMSLVTPIGMSIGPVFGDLLKENFGYTTLFIVSSICGFLGLLLVVAMRKESNSNSYSSSGTNNNDSSHSFHKILSSHSLVIPTLVLLLIGLLFGTIITFLPLFLEEKGLEFSAGLFYTLASITSFLSRIFLGRVADKFGRGLFITTSILCYFSSMILLTQATGSQQLYLAPIFEGIGAGILMPMIITLVSDRSSPQERGQVYSVCLGGYDLGIALAGPIVGILGSELTYQTIFTFSSNLALIAFILFIVQSNPTIKTSLAFAVGKREDLYYREN